MGNSRFAEIGREIERERVSDREIYNIRLLTSQMKMTWVPMCSNQRSIFWSWQKVNQTLPPQVSKMVFFFFLRILFLRKFRAAKV